MVTNKGFGPSQIFAVQNSLPFSGGFFNIRIGHVWKRIQMQKKLTITIDEKVYKGLHLRIGRGNISQFIETLVRPHVVDKDLEAAYKRMAQEEAREAEALDWAEATIGDVSNETR
jgi:hypothetical protein